MGSELDIEIVGIVRDAKYSEVKQDIPPQVFMLRDAGARSSGRRASTCAASSAPRELRTAVEQVARASRREPAAHGVLAR